MGTALLCAAFAVAALALRGAVADLKAGERRRSRRPRHTVRTATTAVAVTAVMLALLGRLAGSGLWPVGILLGFALTAGLAAGMIRRR
ncbi:hypothetical protein [Streptomyces vinaceus]|uniref:hypothetical protein n=1 Tax=Streptomyces vinaceus TaxID=1960 RepID=UPI0036BFCBAC